MIDYEKLKKLDEKIKNNYFSAGCSGGCVDVYEKAPSFYESPRLVISTYIQDCYLREFKACFDDNYIIRRHNDAPLCERSFTG